MYLSGLRTLRPCTVASKNVAPPIHSILLTGECQNLKIQICSQSTKKYLQFEYLKIFSGNKIEGNIDFPALELN